MSASPIRIAAHEARHLALAAQGFGNGRPSRVEAHHLADTIRALGLLQIDFVNVVCPSHYLVPFSRLGPYPRRLLDEVVYGGREFTEQWAHEASIIPMDAWPLLRYRMETHRARPWGVDEILRKHHVYIDTVIDAIRARGPLGASELPDPTHTGRRIPGAWYGSVPRAVLEACFGQGQLAVTARRPDFSRVFDLAERVIPSEHYQRRVTQEDAERELLRRAARALGIATAADLADYFRMKMAAANPRIAELVEAGELDILSVDGWREPAYTPRGIGAATAVHAHALLSPFDPVLWFRKRTARLFGFDYRFEIFFPAAKRRWGSYVLPFLLGDRLVARVDLKADRPRRRLAVLGAYLEPHASPDAVAAPLMKELRLLSEWLGLGGVSVGRRGNLAATLRRASGNGRGRPVDR